MGRAPAAAVAGLAVSVGLELWFNHQGGILEGRYRQLAVLLIWWMAFAVASAALLRMPGRGAVTLLLLGSVVLHGAALSAGPQLSDDVYRYAWDGRVQAAGIDPYRYPPDDPHVAFLREGWLWPDDADCQTIHRAPGCTRLNRPNARTIYPPLGEAWFRVLKVLRPPGARDRSLQLPAAAVDLVLVGLLVAGLRAIRRDPRWAVLYAWSPLAVVASGMDGHVDSLAALLAVGGLWALSVRRQRLRNPPPPSPWWARLGRRPPLSRWSAVLGGALLGAAAAVKLIPALILPVALRRRPFLAGGTAVAVIAGSYVPHVQAVGVKVLGYLPSYLQEEKYAQGGRYLLLGLLGLGGTAAGAVAVVVLAGIALRAVLAREASPVRWARRLLGAAFLLATPVQPWYAVLLAAVAALDGAWEWLAVAVAAYPLYFAAVLDGPTVGVGRLSYGLAGVLVLVVGLLRRRHHGGVTTSRTESEAPATTTRPEPGSTATELG